MSAKKPKMGRPPKPKGEVRTEIVPVRFTKAELRNLKAAAAREGKSVGGYLRSRGGFDE